MIEEINKNKRISAIVVTYNRKDLLRECIEALENSSVYVDIIVIDNNSTDGTEKIARNALRKTDFYYNTMSNIGGAGGFNYGIKKAYELNYDYFWLMDDDTIVQEDTLARLLEAENLLNEEFGFLSSVAYWIDGSLCNMNYHYIAKDWNDRKEYSEYGIIKVERATFVSFFTNREVVKKIGLPRKEYFIWGDDTDYSLRISDVFPCYMVAKSRVVHKMKNNNAAGNIATESDKERIKRMCLSIRNSRCTYRGRGIKQFFVFRLSVIRTIIQIIASKKLVIFKIKSIICGYIQGFFFRPRIEYIDNENKTIKR